MKTLRFAACLVALTLFIGNLVLAADPITGNAAGQPKLQAGLAYERFGDPALERLQETGSTPDIGPMDKGHNDWGLRFTGRLTPPADGDYVFRAEADMGVRVYLDGRPVIDGWARDGARTGQATLTKANPAAIAVEYFFARGKGGKKAELRLFWTPPGGQETPVPATAYSQPLMVEATLARVSKAPKLADIAPYREALVIYEYRVDKVLLGPVSAGTIRVAHWGIYDRLDQAVLNDQPGQKRNFLALLPYHRAGATVEQAKTSDTLEVDLDVPYYFDLGQRLVGTAGLQQDNARPWDYGTSWSEKMGWFFPVHGQLRLVAVGDSRTEAGIDARRFFQPENLRHPVAFNLAVGSAGMDSVELQIREYALRLPKLEWIVWGLSPRIFNRRWNDVMKDRLINSPGYRYDRANPELVWRKDSAGMVMLRKGENDFQDEDFANFDHLSGKGAAKLTERLDRAIAEAGKTGRKAPGSPPKGP